MRGQSRAWMVAHRLGDTCSTERKREERRLLARVV
jgi:hypothetical protein